MGVMWLNGGPGCSSLMGMLTENGPCTVSANGTVANPHSWHQKANVIWVDQPAGTGFSTGLPTTRDSEAVGEKMFNFMQEFYKAFPQFQKNDFYVFGESYGGHYVPAIAHRLFQGGSGVKVPLKGIGIGNGLTDPEEQYKWYPTMAKDGGKKEGGTLEKGVITNFLAHGAMEAAVIPCTSEIASCNAGDTKSCTKAY